MTRRPQSNEMNHDLDGMRNRSSRSTRNIYGRHLSHTAWEALWALEDILRDEGVIPAHALANEILRELDAGEAASAHSESGETKTGLAATARRDYDAVIVDDAQDQHLKTENLVMTLSNACTLL